MKRICLLALAVCLCLSMCIMTACGDAFVNEPYQHDDGSYAYVAGWMYKHGDKVIYPDGSAHYWDSTKQGYLNSPGNFVDSPPPPLKEEPKPQKNKVPNNIDKQAKKNLTTRGYESAPANYVSQSGSAADLVNSAIEQKGSTQKQAEMSKLRQTAMVYTDAAYILDDAAAREYIQSESIHLESSGIIKRGAANNVSDLLIKGSKTDSAAAIHAAAALKATVKNVNSEISQDSNSTSTDSEPILIPH